MATVAKPAATAQRPALAGRPRRPRRHRPGRLGPPTLPGLFYPRRRPGRRLGRLHRRLLPPRRHRQRPRHPRRPRRPRRPARPQSPRRALLIGAIACLRRRRPCHPHGYRQARTRLQPAPLAQPLLHVRLGLLGPGALIVLAAAYLVLGPQVQGPPHRRRSLRRGRGHRRGLYPRRYRRQAPLALCHPPGGLPRRGRHHRPRPGRPPPRRRQGRYPAPCSRRPPALAVLLSLLELVTVGYAATPDAVGPP